METLTVKQIVIQTKKNHEKRKSHRIQFTQGNRGRTKHQKILILRSFGKNTLLTLLQLLHRIGKKSCSKYITN